MDNQIILEKQDLRYLKWSHVRSSSGTAGSFLKSESTIGGKKIYYKLSNFDMELGVTGHECINEIIVDRLLTALGVEHLQYQLIYADIEIEGKVFTTYLCASEDFKERFESKTTLENYYAANALSGESHYDFCKRMGFSKYIDTMLVMDFLIQNRDRHGANIEVLRNSREKTVRIAPYFDHGVSLLFACHSEKEIEEYDVTKEAVCNNYIGSRSCRDNLKLIQNHDVFEGRLHEKERQLIFHGLDGIISPLHMDRIWSMIFERYKEYENL